MDGLRKIITAEQTRLADFHTIENEPIPSIELMERASIAFTNEIEDLLDTEDRILVVIGPGNNGGDGLATARILHARGYNLSVYLVDSENRSPDCEYNLERLPREIQILPQFSTDSFDIIIDALLGSGLTRPIQGGELDRIIAQINQSGKFIISIDIPSGLFCDSFNVNGAKIHSDYVVSFQRPKKVFFYPESGEAVRNWTFVDIGLDEAFIDGLPSTDFFLDEKLESLVRPRPRISNKSLYGHALIIAGSKGKIGAAVLATKACLRSGAGLVTTVVPSCGYEILQVSAPEAMCIACEDNDEINLLPELNKYTSVGIGPGLGVGVNALRVLENLMKQSSSPIVLDADALNLIGEHDFLKSIIPKNSILTPHPKEFERIAGKFSSTEERIALQKDFSIKFQCIVVLKDANTCISDSSGNLYFNTSGNSGMAKGGSGDVLTGIITALLAQNYSPLVAALLAVYYHGIAGDEALEIKGETAMIAQDIIDSIRIGG